MSFPFLDHSPQACVRESVVAASHTRTHTLMVTIDEVAATIRLRMGAQSGPADKRAIGHPPSPRRRGQRSLSFLFLVFWFTCGKSGFEIKRRDPRINLWLMTDGHTHVISRRRNLSCWAFLFFLLYSALGSRNMVEKRRRKKGKGRVEKDRDVFDDVGRTCSEMVSARLSWEREVRWSKSTDFWLLRRCLFLVRPTHGEMENGLRTSLWTRKL